MQRQSGVCSAYGSDVCHGRRRDEHTHELKWMDVWDGWMDTHTQRYRKCAERQTRAVHSLRRHTNR